MYKSLAVAALAAAPALADLGVNVYWGQKGNIGLKEYCDTVPFEYITIAFINQSPENDLSSLKYPGSNFGAHCAATVYKDSNQVATELLSECTFIAKDIPHCQSKGKKVLLSIGGAAGNYDVTGTDNGEYFGEFMFNAFGPFNPAKPEPRPFDFQENGKTVHVSVDGFDFDLERDLQDEGAGYIAMVAKLNELIEGCDKPLLLSAAPECPLTTQYFRMKKVIDVSKFDLFFIQFYNNPSCQGDSPTFNYKDWVQYLNGKPSQDAKLFLGLPGDSTQQSAGSGYLDGPTACALVKDLKKEASFGGVMLWDIYTATGHKVGSVSYLEYIHQCVVGTSGGSSSTTTASTTSWTTTSTTASTTSTTSWTSTSTTASTTATTTATTDDDDYCWEEPTDSTTSTTPTSTWTSTTSTTPSTTASTTTTATTDDEYCWDEPTDTATTWPTTSPTGSTTTWPTTSGTASGTPSVTGWPSSWPSVSVTYVTLTTSTVYTTTCETVTSCAPGGNCGVEVITHTVAISTTVCPVTLTEATWTPSATASWPAGWTTSTVYSTKTYTITSCAPTVTNCPAHLGHVTTEVVPIGTTVCPIESGSWPKATDTAKPIVIPSWQPEGDWTSKTQVTNTQFTTLTVPKPDWPVSGGAAPTGGAVPSWSKPAGGSAGSWPSGAAAPSWSKPAGTATGVLPVATAGAARNSVALGLTGVVAVLFFAL
ncbi:glycoside hydrolase superfamily [Echria macrotheca]|uniref:Glycoside hydrolase superfamily n=1 Tax=Echria macrotheca TaxID=438768 RepID=A0AAJ0F841_9PEZI|nr:glycoside hydrolase superfamily [Echria macrotheca]